MTEEEIISNIEKMLGTQRTYYPQGIVVQISEEAQATIINLLDKYFTLKNELSNSISKDKIRETVDYLDSEYSHNFDNEYWVTMGAIRNKFEELLEE